MTKYNLPVEYSKLSRDERREVREQYVKQQKERCWYCGGHLDFLPLDEILTKPINWALFPKGFLDHPVHLQHNHFSDLTEGAVHAYCNAVLWQFEGR